MPKTVKCNECDAEISGSAKACPKCGAKVKKPLYKRPWFIILMVILVLGVIGSASGGSSSQSSSNTVSAASSTSAPPAPTSTPEPIEYQTCTADQMMNDLSSNAMKATQSYKDQYLEVSGTLKVIDSDGKYISVFSSSDPYAFVGVQCYFTDDAQKETVMEMSIGDPIVVRGKVTDVGEVFGYSMKLDSIN